MLANWNKSPRVNISRHSDTLFNIFWYFIILHARRCSSIYIPITKKNVYSIWPYRSFAFESSTFSFTLPMSTKTQHISFLQMSSIEHKFCMYLKYASKKKYTKMIVWTCKSKYRQNDQTQKARWQTMVDQPFVLLVSIIRY